MNAGGSPALNSKVHPSGGFLNRHGVFQRQHLRPKQMYWLPARTAKTAMTASQPSHNLE